LRLARASRPRRPAGCRDARPTSATCRPADSAHPARDSSPACAPALFVTGSSAGRGDPGAPRLRDSRLQRRYPRPVLGQPVQRPGQPLRRGACAYRRTGRE